MSISFPKVSATTRAALIFLLSSILISGCSTSHQTLPSTPVFIDWDEQEFLLSQLSYWQAEGKLGARNKKNAISARFNWQQKGDSFSLTLNGSFGRTATITGTPTLATLTQPGKSPVSARSVDALMEHVTGWSAPISALLFWGRGIPDLNQPHSPLAFNATGLPQHFNQHNWEVRLAKHQEHTSSTNEKIYLPGKLVAQQKDKKITFLFRKWQLAPSEQISE